MLAGSFFRRRNEDREKDRANAVKVHGECTSYQSEFVDEHYLSERESGGCCCPVHKFKQRLHTAKTGRL